MDLDQTLSQVDELIAVGDAGRAEALLMAAFPDPARAPAEGQHSWSALRTLQQRPQDAEKFMRKAVELEPNSLRHNIALGHLLASTGNHTGAADAYANAMRIDRTWPGLATVYALETFACARFGEAEKAARYWIETGPSSLAWDTLSCALREQNKFQEALAAAEQGMRIDPEDARPRHSRAAALLKLGRNEDALKVLDSLTAQGVSSPAVYLNRGTALKNLKRNKEAAAAFAEGVSRYPTDLALKQAAASTR